MKARSAMRR